MREEIARWYFGFSSWDAVDPRLKAWCYKRADELLALFKEAGYVKLVEPQTLPYEDESTGYDLSIEQVRIVKQLWEAGFRKVDFSFFSEGE